MVKIKITSNIDRLLLLLPEKAVIKQSVMDEIAAAVQGQIKFKIWNAASFFQPNKQGTRLLVKSGDLHNDIKRITSFGNAKVFTDLHYSRYLNDGTEKMVSREYFLKKNGEVPQDLRDIAYSVLANKKPHEIFEGFEVLK